MSFHYAKQDSSGALLMQDGFSYYLLQYSSITIRVQAASAGIYRGSYKDIGDVFDIFDTADFSDAAQNLVAASDPDSPSRGWMTVVPSTTPLFSFAASGNSTPRQSPRRTVL